ncbi:uncharacterized protein M6B38_258555 [Iris pallida]|uniref:Uncharacterized protein n=1 Tax=Iris pallida TaxID=29817 RepID=A0AAX6IEW6_IRIPA|nr:uncharacterized protein M6B38_258555 [Iris pallida]
MILAGALAKAIHSFVVIALGLATALAC